MATPCRSRFTVGSPAVRQFGVRQFVFIVRFVRTATVWCHTIMAVTNSATTPGVSPVLRVVRARSRARRATVVARREHPDGDRERDPGRLRRAPRRSRADPQPCQPARLRRRLRPGQPDPCRRAPRSGPRRDRYADRPARDRSASSSGGPTRPIGGSGSSRSRPTVPTSPPRSPTSTESCAPSSAAGISRADRQTLAATLVRLQHNLHRSTTDNRELQHDQRSDRRRRPDARAAGATGC